MPPSIPNALLSGSKIQLCLPHPFWNVDNINAMIRPGDEARKGLPFETRLNNDRDMAYSAAASEDGRHFDPFPTNSDVMKCFHEFVPLQSLSKTQNYGTLRFSTKVQQPRVAQRKGLGVTCRSEPC